MSTAQSDRPAVVRSDTFVESDPGIQLFVREVRAPYRARADAPSILLLHGARVPGLPSFDLDVPGGSLAADLALTGHPVFIMDLRGYGGSTRLPEMDGPPDACPPLVRTSEAVRDIAAVVGWLRAREPERSIAALGWATGGQWLGAYAAYYPDGLDHLIVSNSLYGGSDRHPSIGLGSDLEDPQHPGRFNPAVGGYRLNAATSLVPGWDRSIPIADKASWYDPAVVRAYEAAALASDPTSHTRDPASFRAPSGGLEDSFYLASGRQLWDAALLRCRLLVLRSELDFWSRPEDAATLAEHAVHVPELCVVTLPNATHFVHLDRAERGRDAFLREVVEFLSGSDG